MANRYSVELDINTKGYKDGLDEAKKENAEFSSTVVDANKDLKSLNKEFGAARRAVNNLALAYFELNDAEKDTAEGRGLKKQLEDAKKHAADLIDLKADLNAELRNMASDTALWDMGKQGIEVTRDVLSALATTIEDVTGKESGLADMIKTVAKIQTIANAVITVGNALQGQSALMRGIATLQSRAAAAALKIEEKQHLKNAGGVTAETTAVVAETAAKTKETAATAKATVAQRLFNTVAKANPYVLLAGAVLTLVGALSIFNAVTGDSTQAVSDEVKAIRELNSIKQQAQKDATHELTTLDILYKKTQDTTLSIESRRKAAKKLIDQYPQYFKDMGTEQILLGNASKIYKQLKNDIIAAATARAYQAKIEQDAAKIIDNNAKIDKLRLEQEKIAARNRGYDLEHGTDLISKQYQAIGQGINALIKDNERLTKQQEKYTDEILKSSKAVDDLDKGDDGKGNTPTITPKVKVDKKNVEDEINKILHSDDIQKTVAEAFKTTDFDFSSLPENYKQYGQQLIDESKTIVDKIKSLYGLLDNKDLTEADKKRINDIIALETEQFDILQGRIEELNNINISFKITYDKENAQKQIDDIIKDALNPDIPESQTFNFDFLPDEFKPQADDIIDQMQRIEDARKELLKIFNDPNATDQQIATAARGLEMLGGIYDQLIPKAQVYQDLSTAAEDLTKHNEKTAKTFSDIGTAVQAVGGLFDALNEAENDDSLKVAGIVAKAVATVALSYANALNSSSKNWATWLAFGISGLATMVSMISSIKKATEGGYAGGGIVGGSSYYGDRMMVRVNSGEMIFNKRQQKNLFNAIDKNKLGSVGHQNVMVTGVIRGKDILLVQKNANTLMGTAGQNINIG